MSFHAKRYKGLQIRTRIPIYNYLKRKDVNWRSLHKLSAKYYQVRRTKMVGVERNLADKTTILIVESTRLLFSRDINNEAKQQDRTSVFPYWRRP
ncbi:MAG: hypothetical protein V3V22_04015 [Methylococcales bacterium]